MITFMNARTGITVLVAHIATDEFRTTQIDDDSENVIEVRYFKTSESAQRHAESCIADTIPPNTFALV